MAIFTILAESLVKEEYAYLALDDALVHSRVYLLLEGLFPRVMRKEIASHNTIGVGPQFSLFVSKDL